MNLFDIFLRLKRADGAYLPMTNKIYLNSSLDPRDRQFVMAHEATHKNQFNSSGEIFTPQGRKTTFDILNTFHPEAKKQLNDSGYSDREVPAEGLANIFANHFNGMESLEGSKDFNQLTDDQKLFLLRQRDGNLTDQNDYSIIDRIKNMLP